MNRISQAAFVAAIGLLAVTPPARADWDHDGPRARDWHDHEVSREQRDWREHTWRRWDNPYAAPPPVVYAPPPRYYVQPPVYYAPAPGYYYGN